MRYIQRLNKGNVNKYNEIYTKAITKQRCKQIQ